MSSDFYKAVTDEIAQVKAEIEKYPPYIRYKKLVEVRSLYSPPVKVSTQHQSIADDNLEDSSPPPTPRIRVRINPERQKIIDLCSDYIAVSGDPVPTMELLNYLETQDIKIAGEEPRNNLSAILSNSGLFDANGRKGWTIKQDGQEKIESEAQDEVDPDEV